MIETPEKNAERRDNHGLRLSAKMKVGLTDWAYAEIARKRLTSSERATFDLEFIKARAIAGVRPAVDLALAAMRTKLMQRLGKPSWRAR